MVGVVVGSLGNLLDSSTSARAHLIVQITLYFHIFLLSMSRKCLLPKGPLGKPTAGKIWTWPKDETR